MSAGTSPSRAGCGCPDLSSARRGRPSSGRWLDPAPWSRPCRPPTPTLREAFEQQLREDFLDQIEEIEDDPDEPVGRDPDAETLALGWRAAVSYATALHTDTVDHPERRDPWHVRESFDALDEHLDVLGSDVDDILLMAMLAAGLTAIAERQAIPVP